LSLLSLESLLKQHSQSAFCVHVNCWNVIFYRQLIELHRWCVWATCGPQAVFVVGYPWNMMFILNVCMWTLDPIPC
jgi:hypothetical protein